MNKFQQLDQKSLVNTLGGSKKGDFEAGRRFVIAIRRIFGGK